MITKLTYKRDAIIAEINMCHQKILIMAEQRIVMQNELVNGANATTDPQVPLSAPE